MQNIPTYALIALGIAAFLFLVAAILHGGRRYRFVPVQLMTGNEREFFGRLRRALPDLHVFPQVAMAAIVAPAGGSKRKRLYAFRRIAQKRVDYAIYTRKMDLICVVELDDRTHSLAGDSRRDAFLGSAGIRTIRWQSRDKPSEEEIRYLVGTMKNNA